MKSSLVARTKETTPASERAGRRSKSAATPGNAPRTEALHSPWRALAQMQARINGSPRQAIQRERFASVRSPVLARPEGIQILNRDPGQTRKGPIQRYAYFKSGTSRKQIYYADSDSEDSGIKFSSSLSAKGKDWADDRYYRIYKDFAEFEAHSKGRPVDVGLIDHLAKWYRLPFSAGFFVLGEAHNVVNYRRLIKESNQTGKILGEGGTVPIDHYKKDRKSRNAAPTKVVGNATEHAMESLYAKTAYAVASLYSDITKTPSTGGATRSKRNEDADDWLEQAESDPSKVRRDGSKKPYYLDHGARVYLKPERAAREGSYSRGNTAVNLISQCIDAIEETPMLFRDAKEERVLEILHSLKTDKLDRVNAMTPKEIRTFAHAARELTSIAKREIGESSMRRFDLGVDSHMHMTPKQIRMNAWAEKGQKSNKITRPDLAGNALIKEQAKENPTAGMSAAEELMAEACTLRDVFMYEAIVDASHKDFNMAGIGNDHLTHLENPLKKVGINTISYREFFSKKHMQDAIYQ